MYEKDFGSVAVQKWRVEVQHGCGRDQGSGICHRHHRYGNIHDGHKAMGWKRAFGSRHDQGSVLGRHGIEPRQGCYLQRAHQGVRIHV